MPYMAARQFLSLGGIAGLDCLDDTEVLTVDRPQVVGSGLVKAMRVQAYVDDLKRLGELAAAGGLHQQHMKAMVGGRIFGSPLAQIALAESGEAGLKPIDEAPVRLKRGAARCQTLEHLAQLNQFDDLSERGICQIDPAAGRDSNDPVSPELVQRQAQRCFADAELASQRFLKDTGAGLEPSRLDVSVQERIDLVGDAVLVEPCHPRLMKFQTSVSRRRRVAVHAAGR